VRGMVMVKKAAALANKELQTIPKNAVRYCPGNPRCRG
jgi:aspartate ammonia-lyase